MIHLQNKFSKTSILIFMLLTAIQAKSQSGFYWGKQAGTDKEEYILSQVVDIEGNVYISGKTRGDMEGKNSGNNDGFISKLDSTGKTIWTRQFGTLGEEDILWSAIDEKGNIYITGSTTGGLVGKNKGKEDIFVVKFNPVGQIAWTRQIGTDSLDVARGIYTDKKGFVYITGQTLGKLGKVASGNSDALLIKLDVDGNLIFINQFGSDNMDNGIGISGDGNSQIYVCGTTFGVLGTQSKGMIDAFYAKFSENGELLNTTQFGTDGFDLALQIIPDDEMNIYVGGTTTGNLGSNQAGEGDCFLSKFNQKGEILWTSQFGTSKHDGIRGIDFNKNISENILVSGLVNLPPSNAFIRMYKKDGNLLWERIFINSSGKNVCLDNKGNIYHAGLTQGDLFSTQAGGGDFYSVKIGLDAIYRNR